MHSSHKFYLQPIILIRAKNQRKNGKDAILKRNIDVFVYSVKNSFFLFAFFILESTEGYSGTLMSMYSIEN